MVTEPRKRRKGEMMKRNLENQTLVGHDFSGADLRDANLRGANLYGADLTGADLTGADLQGADLTGANLRGANLANAYCRLARFCGADLTGANLRGADLDGAKLDGAVGVPEYVKQLFDILPPLGQPVEGWKKCIGGILVHLRVPADARRSNATTRKCRAERVEVLEVIGAKGGVSWYNGITVYRTGETVHADGWDEDRWVECGHGIHFFLTRGEAESW